MTLVKDGKTNCSRSIIVIRMLGLLQWGFVIGDKNRVQFQIAQKKVGIHNHERVKNLVYGNLLRGNIPEGFG